MIHVSGHMRVYQRAVAVNLISSKHAIIYMGVDCEVNLYLSGFYSILSPGRFSQRTKISIYPDIPQREARSFSPRTVWKNLYTRSYY